MGGGVTSHDVFFLSCTGLPRLQKKCFFLIWANKGMQYLLGQWLNFKLSGIAYLVGKIKFKLYFRVPLG